MQSSMVMTSNGPVIGCVESGLHTFRGIPFARAERWQPPTEPEPWSEPRNACSNGPRAIQRNQGRYHDAVPFSEDCLNLCVWTPACDGGRRPVVVYIHGGGHFEGSNSDVPFDGPHLVGDSDTVMVSINYRLGIFGFFYVADMLGEAYEASGNCGLLDQIFALKWVQKNIAAFGGDPNCVTIMGQSAGGKSVAHLMMTPLAKGLFHRAIIQSGGAQCIRDLHTARIIAAYHFTALGVGPHDASRLLKLPARELLAVQNETCDHFVGPWHAYGPVVDGIVFEQTPENSRYVAACPVLLGYTSEEQYSPIPDAAMTPRKAYAKLLLNFGLNTPIAWHLLQQAAAEPLSCRLGRVMGHCTYHIGGDYMLSRLAKAASPLYAYLWDYHGKDNPHHFSEMRFVFRYSENETPDGYGAGEAYLATQMNALWLSFIREGVPQMVDGSPWPCYTLVQPHRMRFSENGNETQLYVPTFDFPEQVIRY